jgi:hypothetical protein
MYRYLNWKNNIILFIILVKMDLSYNYQYFEYNNDRYKDIIDNYYNKSISITYDFGFIHNPIASNIDNPTFILCNLNPKFEDIEISLVCSKTNKTHGKMLIDLVIMKALEMKYKYISLLIKRDIIFVNWYKKQGFQVITPKILPNGAIPTYYYMRKNILLDNK